MEYPKFRFIHNGIERSYIKQFTKEQLSIWVQTNYTADTDIEECGYIIQNYDSKRPEIMDEVNKLLLRNTQLRNVRYWKFESGSSRTLIRERVF
jgi:hypothetical protein